MRILALSTDQILNEVKILENEVKQIKHTLLKYCWYMRGGITYEEAYYLSWEEKEIIGQIVKDNLATTKKTQLPFF
jgi:hypothetical protein